LPYHGDAAAKPHENKPLEAGHQAVTPDADPRSERLRCGGRESKFLAVKP
jgi:hypothetical protein